MPALRSRDRHPSKLEEFEDHTFLIFKTLTDATTDTRFATLQNIMFVSERFLIMRSSQPCVAVAKVWKAELADSICLRKGPDALASRLMRLYVDRYMEFMLPLEA
jgi:magnesium transporter